MAAIRVPYGISILMNNPSKTLKVLGKFEHLEHLFTALEVKPLPLPRPSSSWGSQSSIGSPSLALSIYCLWLPYSCHAS